ncbi:hypothetical protein MADRUGA_54 [Mycobacterium phage Madruga]|uniref:Uncharacterized protein n=1 Tax=Mycobacterium phage Madruga TaxID=1675552 RepID=A0A0K1LS88_9CAUD|nr:hypothetical protein MADRUGA_54 [Mycobacterium phage Madruga]
MSENFCPTCNASGDDPCITASGKPAKKMHATRKIGLAAETIRETAKERFDRIRDFGRAERKAKRERKEKLIEKYGGDVFMAERMDPEKPRPVHNRASRRAMGFYKTAHRGAMKRKRLIRANAEARAFVTPKMSDDQAFVSAPE